MPRVTKAQTQASIQEIPATPPIRTPSPPPPAQAPAPAEEPGSFQTLWDQSKYFFLLLMYFHILIPLYCSLPLKR